MEITINSFSEKGMNHNENEDHVIYMQIRPYNDVNITIAVLCDGMGGMANGRLSAITAAESFMSAIVGRLIHHYDKNKHNFSILNYRDRIISSVMYSIKYANTAVCEVATPGFGSGTTISAVVIADDFLVASNVGDSPAYYYDSDSDKCMLISQIQNRAVEEADDISSEEYDENKKILTHYLGEYREISDNIIQIYTVEKIHKNDCILLMSDGASDICDSIDLKNVLTGPDPLNEVFSKILSGTYSEDDKSIILMEIS